METPRSRSKQLWPWILLAVVVPALWLSFEFGGAKYGGREVRPVRVAPTGIAGEVRHAVEPELAPRVPAGSQAPGAALETAATHAHYPPDVQVAASVGGMDGLTVQVRDLDGAVPWEAIGAVLSFPARVGCSAVIDAGGRARFAALAPGRLGPVRCDAPGLVPLQPTEPVVIAPGVTGELELYLAREAIVSGRVLDATGLAVAGARVAASDASDGFGDGPTTSSGADGVFELGGLRPGTAWIHATHPEHAAARALVRDLHEGERRFDVDVVLDAPKHITGTVVWPDRRPAEGVWVHVGDSPTITTGIVIVGSVSTRPHEPRPGARTDAHGRFAVRDLGRGPYTVHISHRAEPPRRSQSAEDEVAQQNSAPEPRYVAHVERVVPGDDELLIMLERAVELRGRVVDEFGEAIRNAEVSARRIETVNLDSSSFEERSSSNGSFLFEGIPPGLYEVRATGRAGPGDSQRIDLLALAAELELVAPRGARVTGRVQAQGAPVADVQIRLRPVDPQGPFRVIGDVTDAQGRFELRAVARGEYRLHANHESLGRSELLPLTIASGDPVHDLLLELDSPGWIEGQLDGGIGRRAARTIQVMHLERRAFEQVTTDADGRFTVQGLVPGVHQLCLLAEASTWQYDAAIRVEVHPGRVTQVVLSVNERASSIEGRVLAGGEHVAQETVHALLQTGGAGDWLETRTDAQGRFELELAEGGSIAFVFGDLHQGWGESRFVPDGERAALVFDLPTGALSGRILTHDGRPASGALVRLELGPGSKPRQRAADGEGRFAFAHVAPGRLAISAGGSPLFPREDRAAAPTTPYGYRSSEAFELAAGEQRADLSLALPAAASISGSLRLPPGPAPDDIWLVATPSDALLPVARARIDGERYSLRGLGPGSYTLQAMAYGAQPSRHSRTVTLTEGQDLILDLTLGL